MARAAGTAHYLIAAITEKKTDPRTLTGHEKKICSQLLRLETNWTYTKIAAFLCVSPRQIVRYMNELHQTTTKSFALYETEKLARRLIGSAFEMMERARTAGDIGLEWQIEKDLYDRLGKMGFIKYDGEPVPGGDIVLGNKITVENNSTRAMIVSLTDEQRAKLSDALRSAGFGPPKQIEGHKGNGHV